MINNQQDYIELEFSGAVGWIKHSHPAFEATEVKGKPNTWRVSFHKMATFTNKEMDFTAELRSLDEAPPQLLDARSCPCSKK